MNSKLILGATFALGLQMASADAAPSCMKGSHVEDRSGNTVTIVTHDCMTGPSDPGPSLLTRFLSLFFDVADAGQKIAKVDPKLPDMRAEKDPPAIPYQESKAAPREPVLMVEDDDILCMVNVEGVGQKKKLGILVAVNRPVKAAATAMVRVGGKNHRRFDQTISLDLKAGKHQTFTWEQTNLAAGAELSGELRLPGQTVTCN